ncbi:MAG: hypothetical protein JW995_00780 [Melioribacteraceae bacterium]|nr:hypothetical protein [Melioribacteraceae bacterium]
MPVHSQTYNNGRISGTIFLNEEAYLHFEDIIFVHGFIAQTSRLNRVKAMRVLHNNTIRVISLNILKLFRVDEHEFGIGFEGTRVVRNSSVKIETKSRESFDTPYYELSWVLVRVFDEKTRQLVDKRIQFVENNQLNIKKIIFD